MYYIDDMDAPQPICHGYMNQETFEQYSSYCLAHLARHPHLYKKLMVDVLIE